MVQFYPWFKIKFPFVIGHGKVLYDHNELESNGNKTEPHKSYAVEMHLSQLLKTNQ